MNHLSSQELIQLINAVFPRFEHDQSLVILVDFPRHSQEDNQKWRQRRQIAWDWYQILKNYLDDLRLTSIYFIGYEQVGSNNADLPERAFIIPGKLPLTVEDFPDNGIKTDFSEIFKTNQIFIAPTEYSATAPLKNKARQFQFRAATMPGFSLSMIPALRVDYREVEKRLTLIKTRLDKAIGAEVGFIVDDHDTFNVYFDLRFRQATISSGRFPQPGTAGNLPSGETYIVPYEGEKGVSSRTQGILPVQIDDDVLLFSIQKNRAISVSLHSTAQKTSCHLKDEREHLQKEPAYGNMAELGFGVLADFSIQPIGEILIDEKLGIHVAFGRSDHFGGFVGAKDFSSPAQVIHLDRIYLTSTQPRVQVSSIILKNDDQHQEKIFDQGAYTVF